MCLRFQGFDIFRFQLLVLGGVHNFNLLIQGRILALFFSPIAIGGGMNLRGGFGI